MRRTYGAPSAAAAPTPSPVTPATPTTNLPMPHKDPSKATEATRLWRKRNPERYRAAERKRKAGVKIQALALFGPVGRVQCSWPKCRVTDPDVLTLDHIKDDGKQRRVSGEPRGDGLYRKAVRYGVDGLQTLCANHNLKKEVLRRRAK